MSSTSCLFLALLCLGCTAHNDLRRLIWGQNVDLDISSFLIGEHPIRSVEDTYSSESQATAFLDDLNNELRQWRRDLALAGWAVMTNISVQNRQEYLRVTARFQDWLIMRIKEATRFNLGHIPGHLRRQISLFTLSATSTDNRINQRITQLQSAMMASFSSGRACLGNGSCLPLEPHLTNIMSRSRDAHLLKEAWVQWRAGVGPSIRPYYEEFINYLNQGAFENGHPDYSVFWKQELFYDSPLLDEMLFGLWARVKPLYLQLHAYVRRKLRDYYGSGVVGNDGTIPAHLLEYLMKHKSKIQDPSYQVTCTRCEIFPTNERDSHVPLI